MPRSRLWVNFSKEYTDEYFNAVKEENFSNLVCKLLREYYIKNGTTEDYVYNKLDEISNNIKYIIDNGLSLNKENSAVSESEREDDFEVW